MRRYLTQPWWALLLTCVAVAAALAFATRFTKAPATLTIRLDNDTLPADGNSEFLLKAHSSSGLSVRDLTWSFESGRNLASIENSPSGVRLRAGVTPGEVKLIASAPGFRSARVRLNLALDPTDQFGDGTPDFLRLQDGDDRNAFRRWFAFLAESAYFQKTADRSREVTDCAALIRFAYREALRPHDGVWATQWHLVSLPDAGAVRKYAYPHTALGPRLFRTAPGAFMPEDLENGAFAEFADAQSLRRYNTHFISRELSAARPGDLLFFRQADHRMPFHTMIYLGPSSFGGGSNWVVYHTGPEGLHPGEIRRVTISDLLHHPQAAWRPSLQNRAFLGVYRWNILREED